jgi:hypothetical protein
MRGTLRFERAQALGVDPGCGSGKAGHFYRTLPEAQRQGLD